MCNCVLKKKKNQQTYMSYHTNNMKRQLTTIKIYRKRHTQCTRKKILWKKFFFLFAYTVHLIATKGSTYYASDCLEQTVLLLHTSVSTPNRLHLYFQDFYRFLQSQSQSTKNRANLQIHFLLSVTTHKRCVNTHVQLWNHWNEHDNDVVLVLV